LIWALGGYRRGINQKLGKAVAAAARQGQIGLISFSGAASEIDRAISAIPGAVAAAVCKMGGDTVSVANIVRSSSDVGILQFSVWRSQKPPAGGPAKPANNAV